MKLRAALAIATVLAATTALATPRGAARGKAGDRIYADNCASCHGPKGRGDGPNASRLDPRPPDLTGSGMDEAGIAGIVRTGKGACPSWRASLSEDEIAAVARWAKGLQGAR